MWVIKCAEHNLSTELSVAQPYPLLFSLQTVSENTGKVKVPHKQISDCSLLQYMKLQ